MNGSAKPAPEVVTLYTPGNPVEKLCAVGDPLIIEWKGRRYPTLMRGAKAEIIATNTSGGKGRVSILPDSSFFIADAPRDNATAGFVNNAPLTVKFLNSGKVYAFTTALVRVHNQPPVLVLEYPDKLKCCNLRGSERISIVSPARVFQDRESNNQVGAVLDISDRGARLGLNTVIGISLGTTLYLSFVLPNGVAISQLAAVVRNIRDESGKYLLGINFLADAPAIRGFCRNCVECLE